MKSTQKLYAIKAMNKEHIITASQIENILTERAILEKAQHPFLLSLELAF